MDFKEEMQTEFIPTITKMVEKEEAHLVFLRANQKRLVKSPMFDFLYSNPSVELPKISDMIKTSEKSLSYLKLRLGEYIDYANKL